MYARSVFVLTFTDLTICLDEISALSDQLHKHLISSSKFSHCAFYGLTFHPSSFLTATLYLQLGSLSKYEKVETFRK